MEYIDLSNYNDELAKTDLLDDATFQLLLKRSELVLNMSDADLASEFRVSRVTVNRWRSGANTPHVLMRKGVIDFLKQKTQTLMAAAIVIVGDPDGS